MTTIETRDDTGEVTHLEFSNNDMLKDICGPHDGHLVLFERALDISIIPRGNILVIRGDEVSRRAALSSLAHLADSHKRGVVVTSSEVAAAVRLGHVDRAASNDARGASGSGEEGQQQSNGDFPHVSFAAVAPPQGDTARQATRVPAENHVLALQKRTIAPRSAAQRVYIEALDQSELVFGVGPAGTGKTYLAVAFAAHLFLSGDVERVILSRPAVEAGERIGFLPGDMKEKVDPYLRPLYDALYDVLHSDFVDRRIASGDIEIAPLAFMRGRTLSRAAIILDEAQNATTTQMKMFLTRLGEGSRMVITGDPSQTDLPPQENSGLKDALSLLEEVPDVRIARFSALDIVRHPLVTKIVAAYDARDAKNRRDIR